MNKVIYSPLAVGVVILLSLFFGGIIWFSTVDWSKNTGNIYERPGKQKNQKDATEGNEIVCPMDARVCPDGSSVGRIAPDCEFGACPMGATSRE